MSNDKSALWPRVSVVIPCKNMGDYVGQAIESVLVQTRSVHEIIVVDDGSTDHTSRVLHGFGNRIRVLANPGMGVSVSRNVAMLAATGEYIAFLDADDLWYPQKMEIQMQQMRADEGQLSFTDYHHGTDPTVSGGSVLTEYTTVADGHVFSNLLRENFIATSSVVVHRDALALAGLFKPRLRIGEDLDLWLRVARRLPLTWVRVPLAFKRKHLSNVTGSVEYPYLYVHPWEEILWEHRDVAGTDRAYIRYRLGLAAYNAGRHAIRQLQLERARRYLVDAMRVGFNRWTCLWWLTLSCLPSSLIRLLLHINHKISGGGDQRESPKLMIE